MCSVALPIKRHDLLEIQDATREVISDKITTMVHLCNRILLVSPPQVPEEYFDVEVARQKRYPAFPPYGLGIINKRLHENGYVSEIIDLNYEVLASFHSARRSFHYDVWQSKLKERIEVFKPDLIGITCMFSMTAPQMYKIAEFIKKVHKNLPVIAGGVHSTTAAKTVLTECRSIDFISLYEGDTSFVTIIDFINKKTTADALRQIATKLRSGYFSIDKQLREYDIDAVPDYGSLPIGEYHTLGKIGAYHWLLDDKVCASAILSNRGCRGSCTYCSVNAFCGKGIRSRKVQVIVDEMECLKEKYNITHFMWLDDDLLYNRRRALELFHAIVKRNMNISWDASNGVIAASITPEIVDAAYKSGCIGLHLGIESGNQKILDSIRKPSDLRDYRRAAAILKQYPGIFTKGFLMVGFTDETIGQVLDTVNLALELQLDWYPIQILTLFPSTEIHKSLSDSDTVRQKGFQDKFFIGSTGGQRLREKNEKIEAKEFKNLLEADPHMIPSDEQLKDVWFLVDYKVNYERILTEDRVIKLHMLQKMLRDICDRVPENPLSTLFLGILEQRLGKSKESQERKVQAKTYLDNSTYWQKRFEVLNLCRYL
ncbi:MAG: hypothetical protein CV087_11705 [Candidatus Brocadia sp. WS118]|nr:MAG: hypothetical protein CV087_11705 [Candidatus Brocadia sp. WS118]